MERRVEVDDKAILIGYSTECRETDVLAYEKTLGSPQCTVRFVPETVLCIALLVICDLVSSPPVLILQIIQDDNCWDTCTRSVIAMSKEREHKLLKVSPRALKSTECRCDGGMELLSANLNP
ncbi:hypothetical protein CY34DRAFT_812268 [Suillus luteus UH-Slu-Lm8-n1]|uniref:Uncharacterized protein n=1 Tax=Suillus luteus UH-Slu-Lm8-n1 TaxID=930992 RepID=A0A0D0AB21_9AGAM|nr:hypothetical protein CY34DRAFT_812268 [Suillus luteus UH-Slu-Lm8-n1]